MTGVRGRGFQSCMLRAVCRRLPYHRRRHTRCLSSYPLGGAGCRLSNGEYCIGHCVQHAYCPIPNIGEYRPIPNTPIPVSFEPYNLQVNNNKLTMNRRTITNPPLLVVRFTAPACWPKARLQQAVRKSTVRDMATPRRKRSHCEHKTLKMSH